MPSKNFEQTIQFIRARDRHTGNVFSLPIVEIVLISPGGTRITLPLLFDTGASVTTLRAEFYNFLGLTSWDQGAPVDTDTGGGTAVAYEYRADLEIFGKTINAPIHLLSTLPYHPLFSGLLGRDTIFEQFGFGFWESAHEIYVTANP